MHSDSTLPIHPFTGLCAIGWTRRGPIWPVMGGAEDGGSGSEGGAEGGEAAGAGKGADGGSEWKPPASQDDLNRIIESRLARDRARYADYDTLKEKAAQHDALLEELSSDADKAAKKAREDALAEANGKAIPRVVKAEFKAAAKGVLTAEQLTSLLEDRDLTKYAGPDGEPDEEKIAALVAKFAPTKSEREFPDLGGGNRGGSSKTTNMNDLIRSAAGMSG